MIDIDRKELIKSVASTLRLAGLLTWIYVCVRVIANGVSWNALFIDGIPITFFQVAIISFIVCIIGHFVYEIGNKKYI